MSTKVSVASPKWSEGKNLFSRIAKELQRENAIFCYKNDPGNDAGGETVRKCAPCAIKVKNCVPLWTMLLTLGKQIAKRGVRQRVDQKSTSERCLRASRTP